MPRTEAQARADKKSHAKIYDDITLKVRKDSEFNREFIKSHAAMHGESVNAFVQRAVRETMEHDREVERNGTNSRAD